MDTAYKSRASWAMLALQYAHDITPPEFECEGMRNYDREYCEQRRIWARQMRKAMDAATAPAGDERLTRIYVDRQGYLLPEFVAAP